jgi:hypothetical protein
MASTVGAPSNDVVASDAEAASLEGLTRPVGYRSLG